MPCTHSMYYGKFQPPPTIVTIQDAPLQQRLRGRAQWLRERGRIKDAELMEDAAAALDREELARKALAAHGVGDNDGR